MSATPRTDALLAEFRPSVSEMTPLGQLARLYQALHDTERENAELRRLGGAAANRELVSTAYAEQLKRDKEMWAEQATRNADAMGKLRARGDAFLGLLREAMAQSNLRESAYRLPADFLRRVEEATAAHPSIASTALSKNTSTAAQPTKGNTVITSTIGRIVWYYPPGTAAGGPYAAIVTHVYGPSTINLCWFNQSGVPQGAVSVLLHQEGNERPQSGYAEWMPYQKGQAAKTEALEKQIAGA